MTVKSKKLRNVARTAAMSALIVSAIVGTGVVASAATTDNVSRINAGTVVTYANGEKASALHVNGGTLYVASDVLISKSVDHEVNLGDTGTNRNVLVSGGNLIIGQKDAKTAAVGVTMTVDNMTIAGGTVDVTNSSKLTTAGDIDIESGKLRLSGTTDSAGKSVPTSGSTVTAKNVNIRAAGTLEAAGGLQNVVNASGAVNLYGGTITVAEKGGAALTLGTVAHTGATAGNMYVEAGKKFNSYGGTINAGLVSGGVTTFKSGTTTVDNLTVTAETTKIEGNAVVNSKGDAAIEGTGTLEMAGGTLRMKGGEGTLDVKAGGTLLSSANVNLIDGNVKVSGGTVTVKGKSELTINKKLDVTAGAVTVSGGATLAVKGATTVANAAGITVGTSSASDGGILAITAGSLLTQKADKSFETNTGIKAGGIKLNTTADSKVNGVLILSGISGVIDTTKMGNGLAGVDGAIFTKSLTGNNVIFMGATLDGVDATVKGNTNTETISYGSAVTIAPTTGNTFTNSGTIIVPKLVAAAGIEITNSGTTTLVGTGVTDRNTVLGKYSNSGTTNVIGGAGLSAADLTISGGAVNIDTGSALVATNITLSGGQLNVLNSIATLGTLKASGGTIFVDPAFVTINGIDGVLGASLLTSAGSVVGIGNNLQPSMTKAMTDAGFAFGNVNQAVLGIAAPDTITIGGTGVVAVDPSIVKDPTMSSGFAYKNATTGALTDATRNNMGVFYAGAGSLTMLDITGLDKDEAVFAINGGVNDTVNIVNGAKLHIANLTVNGVTIFKNIGTGNIKLENGAGGGYDSKAVDAGWAGKNLIQPDRMLTATMSNTGKLNATVNSASGALGMSSEFEGMMQGVWGSALNNTNSANAGIRFVSRAASTDYGLSARDAGKAIEGAAQLGAVAGVQGVTMSAANAATSAVATRTSFAQPLLDKSKAVAMHIDTDGSVSLDAGLNAGSGMKNGVALWIMPLYQSNNVWGMDAGNFQSGYMSDLGGIAVGADYTVNDMFRFGAALNIGAGYSQSEGDFSSTDNSFNFWGVNLYGGWTMNNFGITADVGYTGNYNKVEQDAPANLGMPNIKADINSSAWTAGLRGEYKFETSVMDIVPHVGVRYMGLTTEQYDVKAGGTAFDVEQNYQSIWTFPIGVTMSKNIETGNGWVFKPQLDLAIIPAAGDVEAKSKSRIPGSIGTADAKMQVLDYITYEGGVGFDFGNENLSFGLNYNIQASEHRTGHGVFGTVRYEF